MTLINCDFHFNIEQTSGVNLVMSRESTCREPGELPVKERSDF
jgi:hypothetical protein